MLAIAYASDNGYAQHVAVSIYSLYNSLNERESCQVYILDNGLSSLNRDRLSEIAHGFGNKLEFIDISDIASRLPAGTDTANLSISTYCRLFAAQLLPDGIDLLLYLDCDTYINDDITGIIDYLPDNQEWLVAGVEDTMYPWMKEGIGLLTTDLYLNAGVLLINLKRWRNDNVLKRFLEFIASHNGRVPHLDQGVINGVLKTGKLRLPLRYNVQAPIYAIHNRNDILGFFSLNDYYDEESINTAKKFPAVVHFTSFFLERPWFRFCLHPLRNLYRDTLALTPYSQSGLMPDRIGMLNKFKDLCFRYLQPVYLKLR